MAVFTPSIIAQKRFFSNMYGKEYNIPYTICIDKIEAIFQNYNMKYKKYSIHNELKKLPIKFYEYYYLISEDIYIGLPIFIDVESFVIVGPESESNQEIINIIKKLIDDGILLGNRNIE